MLSRLLWPCFFALTLCVAPGARAEEAPEATTTTEDPWAGCIQTLDLQTVRPYFLPSNPRVTLTVRFPEVIVDADGSGFTTDEAKVAGEYRISWRDGDDFLSITPLPGAQMRNLNVHLGKATVVLVPYPVESPLKALTSLSLVRPAPNAAPVVASAPQRKIFRAPVDTPAAPVTAGTPAAAKPAAVAASTEPRMIRRTELPAREFEPVGPARLIGMLDRIKLLHATMPSEMDMVLKAMPSISVADSGTVFDQGLLKLQLVRVVRDSRLDLVGFIVVMKNVSKHEVTIDPESWAARVGTDFLPQATSDCNPVLPPGGASVAYFVVAGDSNGRPGYLSVENKFRVSVAIRSPRVNPGADIAADILKEKH